MLESRTDRLFSSGVVGPRKQVVGVSVFKKKKDYLCHVIFLCRARHLDQTQFFGGREIKFISRNAVRKHSCGSQFLLTQSGTQRSTSGIRKYQNMFVGISTAFITIVLPFRYAFFTHNFCTSTFLLIYYLHFL